MFYPVKEYKIVDFFLKFQLQLQRLRKTGTWKHTWEDRQFVGKTRIAYYQVFEKSKVVISKQVL